MTQRGSCKDGVLAALWDMDGVLVESAQFHYEAWKRAWAGIGIELSEPAFRKNFGQRNDTIIRDMLGADAQPEEVERLSVMKEQYYRDAIRGRVEPLPGAIELLDALRAAGFRCAMASAAPRANVEFILNELGAHALFDALVTNEDVLRGKPDPQVYLLAAERVGASPACSVVLEDAVAGVEGAKRAGMACLAVTSNHSRQALARADLVVDSLVEVSPATLRSLILRE
jgi:HAD superfamily hydrolase (TIGR01509 family)